MFNNKFNLIKTIYKQKTIELRKNVNYDIIVNLLFNINDREI